MPANDLRALLTRISSVFRAELRERATRHDLKLVQLEALIFLSEANRYSDTTGALGEYLGTTKGTASQTVMALVRRGLIEKVPDDDDGRVLHCRLTRDGRKLLEAAHPAHAVASLAGENTDAAADAADALLRALQTGGSVRTFGVCKTCAYFQRDGAGGICGLTGEALSKTDALKICREHQNVG